MRLLLSNGLQVVLKKQRMTHTHTHCGTEKLPHFWQAPWNLAGWLLCSVELVGHADHLDGGWWVILFGSWEWDALGKLDLDVFLLKLFVYFVSFYPKLLHFFFAYELLMEWNLNTHMIWRLWNLWSSGGAEPMTGNSPCFWRHGSRQRNCHAWLQKGRHLNGMWCGGSSWTDRMCGRKWQKMAERIWKELSLAGATSWMQRRHQLGINMIQFDKMYQQVSASINKYQTVSSDASDVWCLQFFLSFWPYFQMFG